MRWIVGVCAWLALVVWLLQRWPGGATSWLSALLVFAPLPLWLALLVPALLAGLFGHDRWALVGALVLAGFVMFELMGLAVSVPGRAQSGPRLVVATWNLHNNPARADEVRRAVDGVGADVAFLQEARSNVFVEAFSDWHVFHSRSQLLAARGELGETRVVRLGSSWRGALTARIAVGGREVSLLDAHLPVALPGQSLHLRQGGRREYLRMTTRFRQEQIASLAVWASQQSEPFVIAGDFNTQAQDPVWALLRPLATNAFATRGLGLGYTFPSRLPVWRIDHIWVSPQWRVLRCGTFGGTISDHRGVWAELELFPGAAQRPSAPAR